MPVLTASPLQGFPCCCLCSQGSRPGLSCVAPSGLGSQQKVAIKVSMKTLLVGTLVCLMVFSGSAQAQAPDSGRTIQELERRLAAQKRLLNDWGGLTRYGSENTEIRPPAPGEERVVFLGDQITELWGRGNAKFFPGKPCFNRGISGQTTSQMLVRFRQDVITLRPKVVVILAGTNDLAGVTGPATQGMMAE